MKMRPAGDRGTSDLGWLDSRHTFSFGDYYDPQHMGVSALRVLNDDRLIPGGGFATHSHKDMEILSYVLSGVIEHKDSIGNVERLPAGEFQLMSAGTGVTHSEYNPSDTDSLRFLQIWLVPNRTGVAPGYQQKRFPRAPGRQLIVSPDGRDGSLRIHQDAVVEQLLLSAGDEMRIATPARRVSFLHVISGRLTVDARGDTEDAGPGDGVAIANVEVAIRSDQDAEALLFNLPPDNPSV